MRLLLLFTSLILAASCGQTTSQEIDGAIDIALTHLTARRCDEALEVLKKVNGHSDPVYIQVLASAYACKANYNEISFVVNDLSVISAGTPAALFKSFSIMSTSIETITDSPAATNLTQASQVALAGRGQLERESTFGTRKSGDMGVQALLLNLASFGKFLHYYGNVNTTGVKGAGPLSNKCFLNYTDPDAVTVVSKGLTGACTNLTPGHPDLDLTTPQGKRRVCQGLTYLTNAIDILENLDLSAFPDFDVLADISGLISQFKTQATAEGLGYLIEELSQSGCEQKFLVSTTSGDMEYLYALLFETSLK